MLAVSGGKRQREREERERRERMLAAARRYAALGWPVTPGAQVGADRACSCDRIGCPDPAAHPASGAWGFQASADAAVLGLRWADRPEANVILPTGRVFDVLDVPAAAGAAALERMAADGAPAGPVADVAGERYLFFVATRGAPADEDEWWSCHLDTSPETDAEVPGIRWHCRDSYVLAPPSALPYGREVSWIRPPDGEPLPDPLRVLEVLSDCCEAV
ncbi:bifunctional DNA primase/polymerase [Actinomadura parmotrematis]|uniref:Bifunctional DNA primase/polymerase n=1 Tax=Actinomadura parmotrematis TaxID=2864039 RepID=A0ABS7FZI5_9ACTN|nr:bifunctional DNA primase/polymerase [Actinomadura parmotrematis]MBW8485034.1 bifunctional DNA primase/polymerase [Actinomadura parmotrematis]